MTNDATHRENRLTEARNSFTGRALTKNQFEESWQLAGIMERSIRSAGSFHEKLTDYAHAFARSERFDAMRGETIIRDIFKARYGETMNHMREGLLKREAELGDDARDHALARARDIEAMIADGETMPFYRAYDTASAQLAKTFGITQTGAKTLIRDAYREAERGELYERGKELEERYHRPKVEAERDQREAGRDRTQARRR